MSIISFACRHLTTLDKRLRAGRRRKTALAGLKQYELPYKLHIGCGTVRLDGWVNADLDDPVIPIDLCDPLPLPDRSCSHIYHEHVMEHLPLAVARFFLRECHRVLSPSGRMRIAMPDLESVVSDYLSPNWREALWLQRGDSTVGSRCEAINACFRWWGHQWVYDADELKRALLDAGFSNVERLEWRQSGDDVFRGLETRRESLLICEASRSAQIGAEDHARERKLRHGDFVQS